MMNKNAIVCAGIVTFNPDMDLLKNNIDAIIYQVDKLIIVDNGSNNSHEIWEIASVYTSIIVIEEKKNVGIARALNRIGEETKKLGGNWFLTLDQDSVSPHNMIETYVDVLSSESYTNVGMICPDIVLRTGCRDDSRDSVEKISVAITSGAMVSVDAWTSVGGFWDFLFIDKVDDDFCFRLKSKNYEILRINNVKLEHQIGNPRKIKFGPLSFYTENYPPFRYYYIARNVLLVSFVHKQSITKALLSNSKRISKIVMAEDNKLKKIGCILKGSLEACVWIVRHTDFYISSREEDDR